MDDGRQLSLFPAAPTAKQGQSGHWAVPLASVPDKQLSPERSLGLALHWFQQEMDRLGMAPNTRKAYAKAVALLARYLGPATRLNQISGNDLQRFQAWVERQAQSPKTAELKLTAVRRLFVALYDAKVLPVNIAADMYPAKATSPLPVVLFPAQADAVRRLVAGWAMRADDPDAVPALLITLLLDLGLRIGEAERLHVDDIDLTNPLRPVVHVRYAEARHRAKQRVLIGPSALTDLVNRYRQHPPAEADGERFFPYSRRYLNYLVNQIGQDAGLQRRLTPSVLRWTYMLEQFQMGVDPETLRQRAGLSDLGWKSAEPKLSALARRPV